MYDYAAYTAFFYALALLVWGCGGRSVPSPEDPFALDGAADDSSGFGGTITGADASPTFYDATMPIALPSVDGLDATAGDDAVAADDAPAFGPPFDAGEDGICTGTLGPGDLAIDELMIESVDGTGDHGEWLEVTSNLPCAVDLRGLHGECPRGAKAATFDVADDLWVPALGTFVVADSFSPAVNHDLPVPVVAWRGNLGDVLRNKGTTITLSMNDVVIDTVTYPAVALTVGTSLAFPADCDPATRSDFTRWQPSIASWFPAFRGTPNAPNTDVLCPPM